MKRPFRICKNRRLIYLRDKGNSNWEKELEWEKEYELFPKSGRFRSNEN